MSFPRYPKYKASGVEWLGEVPQHWEIGRVKHYFRTCSGGTPNTSQQELYYADESGIPWVRTTDLQNDVLRSVEVFITEQALSDTACAVLPPGTVMVAMYGGDGTVGKNGLLAIPAAINQAVCGLLPSTTHQSEYAFRFMQFYRPHWMIEAESSRKDPNISQERVRNAVFPKPPLAEQTLIASFLDRETSKIDGLVGEQRRLIELLKEKRQAVISHAVTKGLNPHAPLKPSGIEWLGEIPEHWRIRKIKQLCYVNDGNHGEEYPSEDDYTTESDGVPFIRGGNLQNLTISSENMLYITQAKNASMRKGNVHTNDILFMNRGEIGKLAMIPSEFNGANLNSQIAYLRTGDDIYSRFLLYFLCSRNLGNLIESMKAGSVLTQFPIRDINNIHVPLPPKSEQHEIANSLDQRTRLFDELTAEAERGIELLQERRTALISAAVTGQIDVRGLVVTEAAS